MEEENFEAAAECFEKDIAKEKNLGEAYRGLGIARYELGDYEASIDSFEKALENKAKETTRIYSLMAAGFMQMEEYESALEYYSKALEMKDCGPEMRQEILFNEIAIYEELGDWDTLKEKVPVYVENYPEDDRMEKTVEFLKTR